MIVITIMRHGAPDVPEFTSRIKASEFQECLDVYNNCGLLHDSMPSEFTMNRFKGYNAVISSDLKRSIESALKFSFKNPIIIDPAFREVEQLNLPIPFIQLHPKTWSIIYILLWWMGLLDLLKSFKEAKIRAVFCASKLIQTAEQAGKMLHVGHGFMNAYIAKELIAAGWIGPKLPGKRYWEYGVYKNDTK